MPSWLFVTLASSIPVALTIMFTAFFITRVKINKIKKTYWQENAEKAEISKAFSRQDHGILLWDEKEKCVDPLDDLELEFAINTIIRNDFLKSTVIGFSNYEEKSLIKIAKQKIIEDKYDFALIKYNDSIFDTLEGICEKMNKKGIVMIAKFANKKEIKKLTLHMKNIKMRNEFLHIGKGVFLIVK